MVYLENLISFIFIKAIGEELSEIYGRERQMFFLGPPQMPLLGLYVLVIHFV
jgi:hypothetical protein